nr:hypothetical protein CFP56_07505 [Quercus suber]
MYRLAWTSDRLGVSSTEPTFSSGGGLRCYDLWSEVVWSCGGERLLWRCRATSEQRDFAFVETQDNQRTWNFTYSSCRHRKV